jgi:hypothetical protein
MAQILSPSWTADRNALLFHQHAFGLKRTRSKNRPAEERLHPIMA